MSAHLLMDCNACSALGHHLLLKQLKLLHPCIGVWEKKLQEYLAASSMQALIHLLSILF